MTQLFIAGVETVLPQEFSVTVKRENSFFTKSGEYTYDCTLRLDNPVNCQLYGFLNRTNKSDQLATDRTAVLIADGHVYCRGKEVITRWTEDSVTIQIVSGESELNFFVGQDQKIEKLDLGELSHRTVQAIDYKTNTIANYTLFDSDGTYPQADYCRVPVRTRGGGILNLNDPWSIPGYPNCPQPYLCLVIKRLLAALGYTVGQNQLEQTQFRNLFLVNTVITASLSRILAGWTVKDFLTEIEKLCGIVFVTDNTDSQNLKCDILLKTTFYQDARQLPLNDVIDSYEMEVSDDDSNEAEFTASDVSYQLPDGFWTNLMKLPEGYLEKAAIEDCYNLNTILTSNRKDICKDVSTGRLYIRVEREPDAWNQLSQGETYWQEIDQYCDLDRPDSTSDLELKLVPAPMGYTGLSGVEIIDLGNTDGWHDWISGTVDEESEEETASDMALFDDIRSFSKEEMSAADLYCVFYVGTMVTQQGYDRQYPMAYTDAYHAIIQPRLHPSSTATFSTAGIEGSLRLKDLDESYYQGGYEIDTRHAVTFETFDPNVIDPRQVYVIRNRRYVVRDVEETITAEGRQKMWKVTCYPITISDEAIEKRWILTKGVWDDGAAWLDDGRWIDNPIE